MYQQVGYLVLKTIIKFRTSGFRLVYEVIDNELYILVIAVGKRDKNIVYKKAQKR